jgi:hypothetical protein
MEPIIIEVTGHWSRSIDIAGVLNTSIELEGAAGPINIGATLRRSIEIAGRWQDE